MMRGVHKQVVVLNDPDCEMFEQVILIVKPGYPKFKGSDREKAIKEAGRIVERYMTRYEATDVKIKGDLKLKQRIKIKTTWIALAASVALMGAVSIIYFAVF